MDENLNRHDKYFIESFSEMIHKKLRCQEKQKKILILLPSLNTTPMETNIETNAKLTNNPSVKNVKKPWPFFVGKIKSISNFN